MTDAAIARKFGVHAETVRKSRLALNIPSFATTRKIARTINNICTKCNVTFQYGARRDGRKNLCLNCRRQYDREYKNARYIRKTVGTPQERSGVNHTFFDTWTPNSAYALGLLFTDGCIQKKSSWEISFVNTEYTLVQWLHKILKSNRKITKVITQTKPAYTCFITSTYLGEKLLSLGVIPRKSKIECSLPTVPRGLYLDFIRGLIDGDGCVSLHKSKKCVGGKQLTVSFVDVWDCVCLRFQEMLKELGISSHFFPKRKTNKGDRVSAVTVGGKQAELLCAMLYADNNKICHQKKRANWESYVTMRKSLGGMIGEYVQRYRTTPNYPWLHLLGTMNDRDLAKFAGVCFSRISQLRIERGIPVYKPVTKTIKFRSWHNLVGTMTDVEVSKKTGVSKANICVYRKKMGIPRFKLPPKKKEYSWLHLAGIIPDKQLAKIANVTYGRVSAIRIERGIPSYRSTLKKAA